MYTYVHIYIYIGRDHFKGLAPATMAVLCIQNLIREASRLEIQEGLAVQVQKQSAGEPGKADIADEV